MAVPFDTHVFITELTSAGMPTAQAEALSHQLQDIYSAHAVTKSEFDLAMQKLDTRFAQLETSISRQANKVLVTMVGLAFGFAVALTIALVNVFQRLPVKL